MNEMKHDDTPLTRETIMSMIDAEMSRLKGEIRVLDRERNAAIERMRIAEGKADDWQQLAERDAAEFNRRQAVWLARIENLRTGARRLADHFVSKTTNLVMMRCTYCESEWVRDCPQEHDGDCPVGLVFTALDVDERMRVASSGQGA